MKNLMWTLLFCFPSLILLVNIYFIRTACMFSLVERYLFGCLPLEIFWWEISMLFQHDMNKQKCQSQNARHCRSDGPLPRSNIKRFQNQKISKPKNSIEFKIPNCHVLLTKLCTIKNRQLTNAFKSSIGEIKSISNPKVMNMSTCDVRQAFLKIYLMIPDSSTCR